MNRLQRNSRGNDAQKGARMYPFSINPNVVAVFIPILIVLGVFAVVITSVIVNSKHKELAHKERILAMDKGIAIPEEPPVVRRPAYLTIRAWGFVLTLLGVALIIALWVTAGGKAGVWGLLPTAIGIAMLFAASRERSESTAAPMRME
jgi:cadmium resistance protein CadD (predicted permease)